MSEKTTSGTYVEVNKITGPTVFYNDPKWSITFKSPDSEDSEASEVFEAKFASYSGGILLLEPVTTSKKDEDVTIFRLLEQCLDEPDSNINSALWDAGLIKKDDKVQAITFSCNNIAVFLGANQVNTLAFYYALKTWGVLSQEK